MAPYFFIASMEYVEHEGMNLQLPAKRGEKKNRYAFIKRMITLAIDFF